MKRTLRPALLLLLLAACLPATASATWAFSSETRPPDLLPFLFLGSLALETAVILFWPRPKPLGRAAGVLFLGNLTAFALPFLIRMMGETYNIISPEDQYLIGLSWGFALLVEIFMEYQLLRPKHPSLLPALLTANAASTLAVFLAERLLAPAQLI